MQLFVWFVIIFLFLVLDWINYKGASSKSLAVSLIQHRNLIHVQPSSGSIQREMQWDKIDFLDQSYTCHSQLPSRWQGHVSRHIFKLQAYKPSAISLVRSTLARAHCSTDQVPMGNYASRLTRDNHFLGTLAHTRAIFFSCSSWLKCTVELHSYCSQVAQRKSGWLPMWRLASSWLQIDLALNLSRVKSVLLCWEDKSGCPLRIEWPVIGTWNFHH